MAVPQVAATQQEGILQCCGNNKAAAPGAVVAQAVRGAATVADATVAVATPGVADPVVAEVNRHLIWKNC